MVMEQTKSYLKPQLSCPRRSGHIFQRTEKSENFILKVEF